ncbi:MAG: dicarboxylate/amino acid:cation symporter, partial [Rhodothermales bacterium]
MATPWFKKLHWQIILGLVLGLLFGILAASQGWGQFTSDWIAPWGQIFLRGLLLIAVPLVLASLITGVASLSDMKKLSRIGGKTIAIYIGTTVVALCIGLLLVNIMQPGDSVPEDMRERLEATFADQAEAGMANAAQAADRGPLDPLVNMVPGNVFFAATN